MNKIIRDTKKITRIAEKAQVNIEKGKLSRAKHLLAYILRIDVRTFERLLEEQACPKNTLLILREVRDLAVDALEELENGGIEKTKKIISKILKFEQQVIEFEKKYIDIAKIAKSKIIDLKKVGILTHGSQMDPRNILYFLKNGLDPRKSMHPYDYKHIRGVCFSARPKNASELLEFNYGQVEFIVDPKWVKKHQDNCFGFFGHGHTQNSIVYKIGSTQYKKEEIEKHFKAWKFPTLGRSQPIVSTQSYKDIVLEKCSYIVWAPFHTEWEITINTKIPPTAIIGIILRDSFLLKLGPFIQIMTRLMMKRPDLAVPLYNPSGEVVWPIKI